MVEIEFLPGAEEDYQDALAWYHERSPSAANRFEENVADALQDIAQVPDRWPLCDKRHRLRLVDRFPYVIVYRIVSERIVIVAVAHAKRRPRYWKGR